VKTLRLAFTLYTGLLFALMLFPPWSEHDQSDPTWLDPYFSSLGHHWRFHPPFHWGYLEPYHCADTAGHDAVCGGMSVWEPDENAVIDYPTLKYEALLGAVASAFFALIVGWIGRCLPGAVSRIKDTVSRMRVRTSKDK
jgi:hypothetical protein